MLRSKFPSTTIEIDNLVEGFDLCTTISRETFEQLILPFLVKIPKKIKSLGRRPFVDVSTSSLSVIILTGGSSRIPAVSSILSKEFPNVSVIHHDVINSVACGAAIQVIMEILEMMTIFRVLL